MKNHIDNHYILSNWLFEYIIDKQKFNITDKILNNIDNNLILKINKDFNYEDIIKKNINVGKNKYLKITHLSNKYFDPISIKSNIPFEIYLGAQIASEYNIKIVYFLNAEISPCYLKLFKDQLKDLIKSKISINCNLKLYIVISCDDNIKKFKIKKLIYQLNLNQYFQYEISFKKDHYNEYEGILKVWKLSNISESDFIVYFHGKGISYLKSIFFYIRQPLEKFIFKLLFFNFKRNVEILSRVKSIDKVGILSGGNGWLWYNFWIAKSSHIARLEKPIRTSRSWYYEDWLGRINPRIQDNNSIKYHNSYGDKYPYLIDHTYSILSDPNKGKFNLGTTCHPVKNDFVGLGLTRYTYMIWHYFFKILSLFIYLKNLVNSVVYNLTKSFLK